MKLIGLLIVGVVCLGTSPVFAQRRCSEWNKGVCTSPKYWQAASDAIGRIYRNNKNLGPTFVRLAWHASGVHNRTDRAWGSNGGCILYKSSELQYPPNKGLDIAVNALKPVFDRFPDISCADIVILSSIVSIAKMNGPKINFRPGRQCFNERVCLQAGAPSFRLLPPALVEGDADNRNTHPHTMAAIKAIFARMGFSYQETVALVGAHTVGFTHKNNSGFNGPWKTDPHDFSNGYFKLLHEQFDQFVYTTNGNTTAPQYNFQNETIMMLPSDIAQIFDPDYAPFVVQYAVDETLWIRDFVAAYIKLIEFGVEENLLATPVVKGDVAVGLSSTK